MAKKVSLINMKGGVGKSTLSVNLAWQFGIHAAKRVLLVDLDPQFNASQYLLGSHLYRHLLQNGQATIWDVFEQKTKIPASPSEPFDVRTAVYNRWSADAGGRIDLIASRLELSFSLKTPYQEKERLLSHAIGQIENDYDLVLIDCAPTESILTTAAYLSSDFLLVPAKPEYLSVIGLPLLVNSMNSVRAAYPDAQLELAGIVFNATQQYSPEEILSKLDVRQFAVNHGWYVFSSEVTYSRSHAKRARLGRPIKSTPHARRIKKDDFHQFANEFAQRINL